MQLVSALGCNEGQGWLFGRPMNGQAIRARLEAEAAQPRRVA
jgi:EAL domain-containing protein (putative c-di-GMP-specific phosphodiesterase class I)